jgi:hypothetical protein
MAILARHSQGCRKDTHRAHEFVCGDAFEDLHILEDFFGKLRFLREGGRFSHKKGQET